MDKHLRLYVIVLRLRLNSTRATPGQFVLHVDIMGILIGQYIYA